MYVVHVHTCMHVSMGVIKAGVFIRRCMTRPTTTAGSFWVSLLLSLARTRVRRALSLACSLSRSRSRTRTRSLFLLPSLPSSLFPSLPRSLNLFAMFRMLCISIYPCVRGSLPCMLAHVFTQVHTLTNTHTHTHTHTRTCSLSLSLSLSRARFLSRARAVSLSFSRIDSHTHIHTNTHVYSLTHMDTNRGSWDRRDDLQH